MLVMEKLASRRGVKSDVPNQELAKELALNNDTDGIKEIAENLWSDDKAVQSDCIKVLYEVGYLRPELIAVHVNEFISLLKSGNNRLIWGGMIALSTIAGIRSREIFDSRDIIEDTIEKGSVITVDAGIKTLSRVAASGEPYNKTLFPYLISSLRNCKPKSVAQYSESIFETVTENNREQYVKVLNERKEILSPSQSKRIEKLLKKLQ